MEKYVVYYKETDTHVFAKNSLSKENIKKLKEEGFKKYPTEFKAESKQEAIKQLNNSKEENWSFLSDYSKTILGLSVIVIITLVISILFR